MVRVVLDANVLFPPVLRDVFLEFSMNGLFRALWTDEILSEVARALIRGRRHTEESAAALISELQEFFPGSFVIGYEHLVGSDLCLDPNDEHVLGAAIHSRADVIVTFNIKDFPTDLFESFGIELSHPDQLLAEVFESNSVLGCQALGGLIGYYNLPPQTAAELSDRLVRSQVPQFGLRILDFQESIDAFASKVRASKAN
jgi:predicted nucleic acid-binding protein